MDEVTNATEEIDVDALSRHFQAVGAHMVGPLRAQFISGGRSNLTFKVFDDESAWVLRRPPVRGATPSAHDMSREYRVVAALAESQVPVARVTTLCDDPSVLGAPFVVVEYVEGQVIRTSADLDSFASDDEISDCVYGLVDVLSGLHAVQPDAIGLSDFGRHDGYLERQVRRWGSQWELVRLPGDVRDADVQRLQAGLARALPPQSAVAIVHGDFRIDNTILDVSAPYRVRAVVDWEMSTLGDPLADAALMCVYRDPAFDSVIGGEAAWTSPRLPGADDLAQRYSTASGAQLQHWEFYMALGYFKVAIIAAGIDHRSMLNRGVRDAAGDAVAPMIAAGLRWLGSAGT